MSPVPSPVLPISPIPHLYRAAQHLCTAGSGEAGGADDREQETQQVVFMWQSHQSPANYREAVSGAQVFRSEQATLCSI